jgi:predicted secreted protein with PEFG-CTERM motif
MNNNTSLMLLAALAIVGTMTISSAYAGSELPLMVEADNTTYSHDDTITISGQVANIIPGNVPVIITVVNSTNSIVTIDQVNVSDSGAFETTVNTGYAGSWKEDGAYTINVKYGSQSDKITVELTDACQNQLFVEGSCLPYYISGGIVTGATINTDDNSIIINLDAHDDGTLTVTPSESTQEGIFMVLVDGEEWDDIEINGNEVTVMFLAGAEEIEIIGTFVIPEFGTIAAMILAVAIISIIAISSKSRLSIIPRY